MGMADLRKPVLGVRRAAGEASVVSVAPSHAPLPACSREQDMIIVRAVEGGRYPGDDVYLPCLIIVPRLPRNDARRHAFRGDTVLPFLGKF
jgi:hypothetical protein